MGQGTSTTRPTRERQHASSRSRLTISRPLAASSSTPSLPVVPPQLRHHSTPGAHGSPATSPAVPVDQHGQADTRHAQSRRSRLLRPHTLSTAFPSVFGRHGGNDRGSTTSPRNIHPLQSADALQPLENYLIPETPSSQISLPTFHDHSEGPFNSFPVPDPEPGAEVGAVTTVSLTPQDSSTSLDIFSPTEWDSEWEGESTTQTQEAASPAAPAREDTSTLLTRLLTAAAAATALSLTGSTENSVNDLHSTGGNIDGDDGSFNGFLQSLRDGRLSALGRTMSRGPNAEANGEPPVAMEFFRMFRFGSSHDPRRRLARSMSSRPSSTRAGQSQSTANATAQPELAEGDRMVPVLIVGIRALNEREVNEDQSASMPSFLDSIASVPGPVNVVSANNANVADPDLPNIGPRRGQGRTATAGFNFFSSERGSQRHGERSRPTTSHNSPTETPQGPFPPPSTPAAPLSALSSGSNTPTRRSSLSSAVDNFGSQSRRESFYRRLTGSTTLEPTLEEHHASQEEDSHARPRGLRRRPRIHSWTGVPRHDPRRNGVLMEPGDLQNSFRRRPTENSSSRSWIIYILGGNYPENHPILTTPSLFTDSPTYEDMVLLSTLLGSAKPPVAHTEDVDSAGGLYKVDVADNAVVLIELAGEERIPVSSTERCLVCLTEYEQGEEVRKLGKCRHFFHRECIDQWLTTGRNSCPLCRGQGVDERDRNSAHGQDSSPVVAPVSS